MVNPADLRRVLVFLLYDPAGVCDRSVLETLEGFRPHVETIFVVVNGSLETRSLERVSAIADQILERPNIGYDVGAYREALSVFGWDKLAGFDELLLVNYTFFGPVGSFGPMLETMGAKQVDFWGVTDHPSMTPNPYTGKGTLPAHLQSYWLGVRGSILRDPAFRNYWIEQPDPTSYSEVVTYFEARFTEHFSKLGYKWEAAFPAVNYGVDNTTMEAALALLEDGCPLFKKRLYFHDVPGLVEKGISTALVTAKVKGMGYSENLIIEGVARRATTRELTLGLGASYIQPGSEPAGDSTPSPRIKLATESPWKVLSRKGVEGFLGAADILLVPPRKPKPRSRADGSSTRYVNAFTAIIDDPYFILGVFDQNDLLGALYPYMQPVGAAVKGRKWHADSMLGHKMSKILGLKGPFTETTPVAPYRGAAAYRRPVLEKIVAAIENAGGWDSLSISAGGDKQLTEVINVLSGDFAREAGYFVGETGTVDEVGNVLALVTDILGHAPRVYREYTYYPYSARVVAPTLKNRIGQSIKKLSPSAFEHLHSVELRLRTTMSQLRKVKK